MRWLKKCLDSLQVQTYPNVEVVVVDNASSDDSCAYLAKNPQSKMLSSVGPLARYVLFFSRPVVLFRRPIVGLGLLFMKTAEYMAGAIGYLGSRGSISRQG